MGFLIDDYAPQKVDDVFFHKDIYDRLKKMANENSIPHIIFHGEPGAGKKTMVNIFLDMIYDGETKNIRIDKHKISGSGSKVKEEITKGSKHHIVINPTGVNFDRYLIHTVIKNYAGTRAIGAESSSKYKFRVIQIDNLDKLSQSAQNSLRRMIEVNSSGCRFIMWANNLSNVIDPLKSRGFCIRVPRPTPDEMFVYLTKVSIDRNYMYFTIKQMNDIVEYSECNIKTALWCLQSLMYDYSYMTNYDWSINEIVNSICKCDLNEIDSDLGIRDRLFNLMITNYEPVEILRSMMNEFINRDDLTDEIKMNIIIQTSKTEYDLVRSRRDILHFDAFTAAVMNIIHKCKSKKVYYN